MKQLGVFLLTAWGVLSPPFAAAQDNSAARAHLEKGIAYARAGDTTLAFAELGNAISVNPRLADAHYYLGRLYTHRSSAIETDFKDRRRAESALLKAIRLNSDDPRYVFELGLLRLKQHMPMDAARLMGRSLSMAKAIGDPAMLAEIHFNLGYISDLRYQSMRNRRRRPMFGGPPTAQLNRMLDFEIRRYTRQFMGPASEIEESGSYEKDVMIEHYRAALQHDPGHIGAATRLLGHLYDENSLNEYYAVARKLVKAQPDSPEAYLFRGLGLHEMGREDEAGRAFDEALRLMSSEERRAIENLEIVLRRGEADKYRGMGGDERSRFEEDYWQLKDPLFLTAANERRLEHLSRVAYADLRFTEPSSGKRGWETDRGIIFIRYGFPESVGSFSAQMGGNKFQQGKRQVIWSYGKDGPVFGFAETPGYIRARFAGDYKLVAENYRHILPAKYDQISSIADMFSIPVQIARFRGETPDEVAVEIHAALPIDSIAMGLDLDKGQLETGLFIVNRFGERIVERLSDETLTYAEGPSVNEFRSWRVIMPESGPLLAAVEARDPLTWRTAVARDTFTAVPFGEDTLGISDILIAEFLRPLVNEPRRRADFDIAANPSLRFRSGDQIHIYYELYGLKQDAEGFASYDVSLTVRVKSLERGGGVGRLLGGLADAWGFSVVGDDRLELRFHREVRMDELDRVTEFLTLDPNEVPAGEYEIRLRIWDRGAERMAERSRPFYVVSRED